MARKRPAFPSLSAILVFILSCAIQTAAQSPNTAPRITQAIDEANLVVLRGNTHPLALPKYDQGAAPASLPMQRMLLVLQRSPEQEAALDQLLEQQQDNSSPNYHRWLTPQQFGADFGPAAADIQTITAWLQSHGFQVTRASKGGIVIEFSGTAGQVQETFHTSIHKYVVNSQQQYANSSDPQIPAALVPVVAGVRSLNNFPVQAMNHPAGVFRRDKDSGKILSVGPLPIPQFTAGVGCGILRGPCEFLGPFDLATIYNFAPLWNATTPIDGTGQTIAIVGDSDINPADWAAFWNMFGVTTPKGTLNIIHDGPAPGIQGDEAEADIDTQWSSAVAKGATIDLVVSQQTETTFGVDLSAEYIVDNNLAPVMSESFGLCELFVGTTGNAFYNALWQQASAQGITVLISSGDQGSAGCDRGAEDAQFGLAVSGFESTPFNVSVGGTDFNDLTTSGEFWNVTNNPNQANAKGYIPEMTWNDTCTNAEIFPFTKTTTAEQTCNNTQVQQEGFLGVAGGSGGASNCTTSTGLAQASCSGGYPKPSWQQNVPGVPADGKRDVPDVSLFASNGFNGTGYIVCESDVTGSCNLANGQFLGFGGTSVSSPAFAGIMALINQQTGERQGNANYVFYKMAATAANSCNSSTVPSIGTNNCIFYDIPSGSTIAMPCAKGSPNCTTSSAADSIGVLSGYSTTSGYDLATGLGSVNVQNLVNQWSTFAGQFKATKFSSFTLGPPITITHGQSIPVGATVVPQTGTGTPTGSVVLITNNGSTASGQQAAQQLLALTNGSLPASSTTTFLPGGTSYTVTAHYGGDATFAPSDSSPVTVTVNPEPSKTFANFVTFGANGQLTSFSASSATYGAGSYLLRLDVGDAGASFSPSTGISSNCSNRVTGCPTGSLALTSNGAPLDGGSLPLNIQGFAEDQSLATGSYAISAHYPGDSSFGPSAATVNFTIAKAPTTAAASVDGLPIQYGVSQEIAASLQTTSIGVVPTGTFTFSVDGAVIPVSALVNEGFPFQPNTTPPMFAFLDATALASFPSLGKHNLTAAYSGDANYASATSPPFAFTVTQAQPFFETYGASPASINLGQQVTLSAQLGGSNTGVPPTGTMTFHDGNTVVSGTVTYTPINATPLTVSALKASMPYTPTSAGTHGITVTYSGDTNYLPATASNPAATLIVTGPGFNVVGNPTSIAISSPGGSGSSVLTFSATNGFSGTIPLSPALCSGMPSETTCSWSVPSLTLSNATPSATASVIFQTTPRSGALPNVNQPRATLDRRIFGEGLALFCVLCVGVLFACFSPRRRRLSTILALLTLASVVAIGSCGGGGSSSTGPPAGGNGNPGTPQGTDANVVITFSGAGVTPPPTMNLTINVQ